MARVFVGFPLLATAEKRIARVSGRCRQPFRSKSYIIDELAPDLGQIAERWDLGEALLVVPVRMTWDYQESQVGLLVAARPREGRASDSQVALMTLDILTGFVAGSMAGLFARERLNEASRAIREGERRTHLLKEVALAANQAMSPEDAFQVTVDQVCTFTGWPVGHVYLPAGDGTPELVPTEIWHLDDSDAFTAFKGVTATARFAPGVGLPGRVLSSGAPAWIEDLTVDPNAPRAQQAKDIDVRGAFAFPVMVENQVAAVLEFFSRDTEPPDEPLLDVMGQIGVQLGNVIHRQQKAKALEGERALLAERVAERTAELQVANAQLEQASGAKDEFLASMSHELRTPLNAVLSLSESLLEGIYGEVNERQVKTVGMIESSGRHLLSLINDILDLSKVAAGKMELSIRTVDVEAVCKTSMLFVRERAVKKGVKLETFIDPQVRTVQADERRLKQMLVNLLTNAVKFTDEGTGEPTRRAIQATVSYSLWSRIPASVLRQTTWRNSSHRSHSSNRDWTVNTTGRGWVFRWLREWQSCTEGAPQLRAKEEATAAVSW
ncbi:MAG: GAF domain-containing protein [Deltaproteobacteria bacterium]|nr:GAF domain-containing protein [Deltaproteobacteria bacterium]